jgi:uncharacterized protein with HEPN domain
MPDPFIVERLELILDHAQKIHSRLETITDAGYFISSDAGEQLYDSLITRLQAMGENFKKIDKLDSQFITGELKLDSTPIVRFRDLISHHYELLDYQVVYRICKIEIPAVITIVESYLHLNR